MKNYSKEKILSIIYISYFITFINIPGRQYFTSLQNVDAISLLKIVSRISIVLIAFLYLITEPQRSRLLLHGSMRWLLMYNIFAVISLIYSSNRFYSLVRVSELFFFLLTTAILTSRAQTENDIRQVMEITYKGLFILLIIVWGGYFFHSEAAQRMAYEMNRPRLGGYLVNSNTLGGISSILFTVALNRRLQRRGKIIFRWESFLIILTAVTQLMTFSRSGFILTVTGSVLVIIFLLVSVYKKEEALKLSIVLLLIVTIVMLSFPWIITWYSRNQTLEEISGRLPLWKDLILLQFLNRLLFGYGFQMLSSSGIHIDAPHAWYTANAHNGFIQCLVGLGGIGFLLLIISVAVTLNLLLRKLKNQINANIRSPSPFNIYIELIAILSIAILNSMTEFGIGGHTNPILLTYLMVAAVASSHIKKHPTNEHFRR